MYDSWPPPIQITEFVLHIKYVKNNFESFQLVCCAYMYVD